MNKANAKAYIWIIVISTVVIWALVLYLLDVEFKGTIEAIKKLPLVVTIEAIIWLMFTKWAWKWNCFQSWLVIEPIVEGTWMGTLKTTWVDPESGVSPDDKAIVLTVKQDFYSIHCNIYTEESMSHSYLGGFYYEEYSPVKRFIYTYTNKPKSGVQYRSEFHDGTANLRITGRNQNRMEGDYWTTRKSTGSIEIEFQCKELVSSFGEAQ